MAYNQFQKKQNKGGKRALPSGAKACPTRAETEAVLRKVREEMMATSNPAKTLPEPFLRSHCIGGRCFADFDITVPYDMDGHASVMCATSRVPKAGCGSGSSPQVAPVDMAVKYWSPERAREAPDQPDKEVAAAGIIQTCKERAQFVTVRKIYTEPAGSQVYLYENAGCSLEQIRAAPWYNNKLSKRQRFVFNQFVFVSVCKQLAVLHRLGLYHRDIKPGNVMLDYHQLPRVADFGLAVKSDLGADFTIGFDLRCLDPEQLRARDRWGPGAGTRWGNEELAKAATSDVTDVFQLASMLWEMMFGKPYLIDVTNPKRFKLNGTTMARLPYYEAVLAFNYREDSLMLLRVPKPYRKVLGRCLSGDASQRPTAAQLLDMPCFRQQCQLYDDLAAAAAPAVEAQRAAIDAWAAAGPEPTLVTAAASEADNHGSTETGASVPLTPQLSMMLRRLSSLVSSRRNSTLSSDGTDSCSIPSSSAAAAAVAEVEDTAVTCLGGMGKKIKGGITKTLGKVVKVANKFTTKKK